MKILLNTLPGFHSSVNSIPVYYYNVQFTSQSFICSTLYMLHCIQYCTTNCSVQHCTLYPPSCACLLHILYNVVSHDTVCQTHCTHLCIQRSSCSSCSCLKSSWSSWSLPGGSLACLRESMCSFTSTRHLTEQNTGS